MNIVIIANALHTNTITGGDKIFVECAKQWIRLGHNVTIITNEAGVSYCESQGVAPKYIMLWRMSGMDRYVYVAMMIKTCVSLLRALFTRIEHIDVVFASSFFFPDILSALVIKLRNASAQLVTSCYIFTSMPWGVDYSGGRIKGLLFYLNENISIAILKRYQGIVLVASACGKNRFATIKRFPSKRILSVGGGVDNAFFRAVPAQRLTYDAVFVGRFHPQKCVDELIGIWKRLVAVYPKRKLALIGGGPLEEKLRRFVTDNHLEASVLFMGILDGVPKVKILKSSRLFVSASRYDTGNIALDEALACGAPGIIYDLPDLNYPQGVLKVPIGHQKEFAATALKLLNSERLRQKLVHDALLYAKRIDWKYKARKILSFVAPTRFELV